MTTPRLLEPVPLRDVEQLRDGHWRTDGPSPLIALRPGAGTAPVTGDVLMSMALVSSDEAQSRDATLVVDTGEGPERALRIPLQRYRAGRVRAIVTLPAGTVGLALDPGPGTFKLDEVSATELSSARAFFTHAAPQLRRLARDPAQLLVMAARAVRLLRYRGFAGVLTRLRQGTRRQDEEAGYAQWVSRYATLSDEQRAAMRLTAEQAVEKPLVTILLAPGANKPGLKRTLDSLAQQLYPNWELLLSTEDVSDETSGLLEQTAFGGRIRLLPSPTMAEARGAVVARLEVGDVLSEDALFAVVAAFAAGPKLALVYTDEDERDTGGQAIAPAFKPDWSPELLRSRDYIGRAAFFRMDSAREVAGLQSGALQSTTHEFLLRFTARLSREEIRHLPLVLLHVPRDLASPTHAEAGVRAVQSRLEDQGAVAVVRPGLRPATYHVTYRLPDPLPRVTVIIPTRDREALLRKCVESLQRRTAYQAMELVVVDNDSRQGGALSYLETLERTKAARVLRYPQPFNYSAMNNLAVQAATGDLLCFLNNDVEALGVDWLREMASIGVQPEVGAVGAKLLYPNDTVQHAGVVAGLWGLAAHPYLRRPRTADGYLLQLQVRREVAAVTAACMVIRRQVFLEVGGFDEDRLQVAFSDFDLCFKLLRAGYRNVWTPYAELRHLESASRGVDESRGDRRRFLTEESVMRTRWADIIEGDPYYNPNLSLDSNVPRPAWPPRVVWPPKGER